MGTSNRSPFPPRGAIGRTKPGRRRRWLIPALLFGLLIGVLAGLFFYTGSQPSPVVLVVPIDQYEHKAWPPNPWAESDARAFTARMGPDAIQTFQRQKRAELRQKIEEDVKTAGADRPLIVYLNSLGTVAKNIPYLLPSDATPDHPTADDPSTWLALTDVLNILMKSSAQTLLILDVRPVRSPLVVYPTADVAEKIEAVLTQRSAEGTLPFTVLHANTPAEGPAVLSPLPHTVFGLAVAHAVGGAANGWGGGDGNDRQITLLEFTDYVRTVTHAVSKAYGGATQTPAVHGPRPDFKLVTIPKGAPVDPPAIPTPPEDRPYPPELTKAWTEADTAIHNKLHLRAPRLVHPYLRNTTLAEQRWLAGRSADAVSQTLAPKPDAFHATTLANGPVHLAPVSIARAARLGRTTADHRKAAEKLLEAAFEAIRQAKKDELTTALDKIRDDKTDPPIPFDAVAAVTLDAAIRLEKPTHEQYRQLFDAASRYRTKNPYPLSELVALELIAGVPPDRFTRWQPGTAGSLLDVVMAAERVAAFDPRYQAWVAGELTDADALVRTAIPALGNPNTPTVDFNAARGKLTAARTLYADAETLLERLEKAHTEAEETRAVIDDLGSIGPTGPGPIAKTWETSVVELADHSHRLRQLLTGPAAAGKQQIGEISKLTDQLRDERADVLKLLTTVGVKPSVKDLERLTRWPWVKLKDREALLARLRLASHAATGTGLTAWPTNPAPPPAAGSVPHATLTETVREIRVALALLRVQPQSKESSRDADGLASEFEKTRSMLTTDPVATTAFVNKLFTITRKAAVQSDAPNQELVAYRRTARGFDEGLAMSRYQALADAVRSCPMRDGYSPAARWAEIAAACRR